MQGRRRYAAGQSRRRRRVLPLGKSFREAKVSRKRNSVTASLTRRRPSLLGRFSLSFLLVLRQDLRPVLALLKLRGRRASCNALNSRQRKLDLRRPLLPLNWAARGKRTNSKSRIEQAD